MRPLAEVEAIARNAPGRVLDDPFDEAARAPRGPSAEKAVEVRFADLDMNRHANNVSVIGWALEALPEEVVLGAPLRELEIEFRAEALHGETDHGAGAARAGRAGSRSVTPSCATATAARSPAPAPCGRTTGASRVSSPGRWRSALSTGWSRSQFPASQLTPVEKGVRAVGARADVVQQRPERLRVVEVECMRELVRHDRLQHPARHRAQHRVEADRPASTASSSPIGCAGW